MVVIEPGHALMLEKDFVDQIEEKLAQAGFDFEREPSIGGLRPDFMVQGPSGEIVVVEAKVWDPKGGNTARAWRKVKG